MNWGLELQPVAPADVLDAIDELVLEGEEGKITAIVVQLDAAKAGAKASIEDLDIDEGMLIGVEFAGTIGTSPLPSITTRIRQVEAPPEPEPEEAELEEEAEAPALA